MPTKDELKQVFVTGAVPTQQDFHDLIDLAGTPGPKGDPGATGANGVSIVSATSDGTNIVFTLSDDNTLTIPWPTQGG
ncbi:hypothetical protein MHI57_09700 [Cytobacillus sp. FSL K6-0129]|uniref:hypothetical protein n=1 Tax=Cytobacillus sp. FSL K6-0129 TaxID=2921421 RepID=UPI0030F5CF52